MNTEYDVATANENKLSVNYAFYIGSIVEAAAFIAEPESREKVMTASLARIAELLAPDIVITKLILVKVSLDQIYEDQCLAIVNLIVEFERGSKQ